MYTQSLNNNIAIPCMGLGTYRLSPEDAERSVHHALQTGYRLIDTANMYMNEKAVGRGIAQSDVHRTEVFLTTKLWPRDYSYDKARAAIDASMKRLGVDYLDLVLLHQPVGAIGQAWRALEDAIDEGKVRAIGVSNFTVRDLEDLMHTARIVPAVNQIECHPYCQQTELKAFMDKYGIAVEAWYPLGSANAQLMQEPIFASLAARYHKSVPQIILRWHLQSGYIVIPGSRNFAHIESDFDIFDFDLTDTEMASINALDKKKEFAGMPRFVRWAIGQIAFNYDKQE